MPISDDEAADLRAAAFAEAAALCRSFAATWAAREDARGADMAEAARRCAAHVEARIADGGKSVPRVADAHRAAREAFFARPAGDPAEMRKAELAAQVERLEAALGTVIGLLAPKASGDAAPSP